MHDAMPAHPVLGVIGRSGSGKTTLLEFVVKELAARGLRVNLVKHSHHDLALEVFRPEVGQAPLYPHDPYVIAVASDSPAPTNLREGVQWLDLNAREDVLVWLLLQMENKLEK